MIPLSLKPHEARRLAEAGSVLIVRPVSPQPAFHGAPTIPLDVLDRYETDWGFYDEDREYVCPFGRPGSETWGRETWMPWHKCSHEYDEWEPVTREFLESRGETFGGSRRPGIVDAIEYRATSTSHGPWRSPATMPRWASRFPRLVVATVRARWLSGLTDDDANAAGIESIPAHYPDRGSGHRYWLFDWWDRDYPKFPAASDPWVFAAVVKRRDDDGT